MSVLRTHRHERDFTILGNPTIRDQALSFRARGLLVFLLSQQDGYPVNAAELAKEAPEGRDAIVTALKELAAKGYLARRREQGERGRWRTFTDVYETPELASTDNGFSGVGENRRPEAITAGRTDDGFSDVGQAGAIEKGFSEKDQEGPSAEVFPADGGAAKKPGRPKVEPAEIAWTLAHLLAEVVERRLPQFGRPKVGVEWAREIDLLMRKGPPGFDKGLDERQIRKLIDWLAVGQGRRAAFWATNIRSAAKLRAKAPDLIAGWYEDHGMSPDGSPLPRNGHLRPVPPPTPEADLSARPPLGDAAALDAWADAELAGVAGR